MSLPSDIRLLLLNRVAQVILYLREYWVIADQLITHIDANTLTGLELNFKLNAAVQIRRNLAASIGGVSNADVRTEMASQYSITNIVAEINATNTASTVMLKAMSNLLSVVSASGQVVTANDTKGQVDSIITSPNSDILRAACITLRDTAIDNPNL